MNPKSGQISVTQICTFTISEAVIYWKKAGASNLGYNSPHLFHPEKAASFFPLTSSDFYPDTPTLSMEIKQTTPPLSCFLMREDDFMTKIYGVKNCVANNIWKLYTVIHSLILKPP